MLVEGAGKAQLAVFEHVARRGAEPGPVARHALQMRRDDPGHHRLHLAVGVAVEQARLEGADEKVGAVAGHAEIDAAGGRRILFRELRRHRLVVAQPLPEDERIADEQISVGRVRRRWRHARCGGIEMIGLPIDEFGAPGGGGDHFTVGFRTEAQDRVGRRPPLGNGAGHDPHVHGLRREQAGEQVERHQAERQRGRQKRAAAPAIAAQRDDAHDAEQGRSNAGPEGRLQDEPDPEDHEQEGAYQPEIAKPAGH